MRALTRSLYRLTECHFTVHLFSKVATEVHFSHFTTVYARRASIFNEATSVWGRKLPVYEALSYVYAALSYLCMRPYATSV